MPPDRPTIDWKKTRADSYHGGRLEDEIAALLSLVLGVRMMAGGPTRVFDPSMDPRGRPQYFNIDRDPVLPRGRSGNSVIPRLPGKVVVSEAGRLRTLPSLSARDAAALVQAARLYQDALWICDAQPQLSWVMLVSAVEVAAGHSAKEEGTPSERLEACKPDLAELVRDRGGEKLLGQVAEMMVDSLGATRKFVGFVQEFLPPPPTPERSPHAHVQWDDSSKMKKALRTIYGWRSHGLHRGTPFPLPMCEPPYQQEDVVWEKPFGRGTAARGAVWTGKDMPMLLHTFEYIVRNSLLKWWDSLLPDPDEGSGTT